MAWACCKAFATGPFLRCTPKAPLPKGRRAAAVNTCRVPVFSLPILLGNDTGRVREVTIRRRFPCALSAGTARKAPLLKGAGTAKACLRDSQWGLSQKHQPMWKPATLGNPPGFAGGKTTPTMARGALACASTTTALTIPGTGGAVTICRRFPCEIGCGHWPPIPGTGGAVTIRRRLPCALAAGTARKAPLRKGAGTALAVTEGFHSRHFPKSTNLCGNLQASYPPASAVPRHPPLARGGFGAVLPLPPQ